jgi:hypothetical protein
MQKLYNSMNEFIDELEAEFGLTGLGETELPGAIKAIGGQFDFDDAMWLLRFSLA